MSERGSWITEYIYCEETVAALKEYFEAQVCPRKKYFTVTTNKDVFGNSILAGRIGGLYMGEEIDCFENEMVPDIEKIIKAPVRICVLAEAGSRIFVIDPAGADETEDCPKR